jgi:hypothetical protein
VNNLTDPGAIKVLHMAMQFARGAKKVVTQKVNKTPTKIVKNSASAPCCTRKLQDRDCEVSREQGCQVRLAGRRDQRIPRL